MLTDGYTDVPAGKIAAVVTSLEMRAPPVLPPPNPGAFSGLTLTAVQAPDLAWYRELFRRVGLEWLWFSRLRLDDGALTAIIRDPGVEIWALSAGGRAEGFFELDFRVAGECELAFLGLTGALHGRGAGRALLHAAIGRAWTRPIARLWLHTCTLVHPAALPLYRKAGFTPFRRRIEIGDDPRLTGEAPRTAAPQIPLIDGSKPPQG